MLDRSLCAVRSNSLLAGALQYASDSFRHDPKAALIYGIRQFALHPSDQIRKRCDRLAVRNRVIPLTELQMEALVKQPAHATRQLERLVAELCQRKGQPLLKLVRESLQIGMPQLESAYRKAEILEITNGG